MADERCPVCDLTSGAGEGQCDVADRRDAYNATVNDGWGTSETDDRYREMLAADRACRARRVDWRARCLKAEQERDSCNGSCDIEFARRQVGPDGVVPGNAKECAELWEREAARRLAALADRDQQIAALREQLAQAERHRDRHVGRLAQLGAIADALPIDDDADEAIGRAIAEQSRGETRRPLGRAAIEEETIEQVAEWLEQASRDDRCSSGLVDSFRSGKWRPK